MAEQSNRGVQTCQAAAMDFATFLGEGVETVPPCDEPAADEIAGWKLCAGCADALRFMVGLGERLS